MARQTVSYFCGRQHETTVVFAATVTAEQIPPVWDCRRCGAPAGPDPACPPSGPEPALPAKTPLDHARERRSPADADALLQAALAARYA